MYLFFGSRVWNTSILFILILAHTASHKHTFVSNRFHEGNYYFQLLRFLLSCLLFTFRVTLLFLYLFEAKNRYPNISFNKFWFLIKWPFDLPSRMFYETRYTVLRNQIFLPWLNFETVIIKLSHIMHYFHTEDIRYNLDPIN